MVTELELAKSRFQQFTQVQPIVKEVVKGEIVTQPPTTRQEVSIKPDIVGTIVKSADFIAPWNLPINYFNLLFGTREQKVDIAGTVIGADVKTEEITTITDISSGTRKDIVTDTTYQSFEDKLSSQIDIWKSESETNKKFWETATLGTTDITLPDITFPEWPDIGNIFGDIGKYVKWALIGGGVLLGLYLISKIAGGKK